ncbi:MAG: glycosyltransferase family 39 protein [Chloroflexi bacterium]|nr:glycosyltransferase family 39 protein [Chloroflexota bacterium]
MSQRESILSALAIFVVALMVRAFFAAQIVFPKPEDTAYYVGVARNLLEGRGLVSDALWSYGTPPLILPRPAFEVWLPLPTWLAALPMALFGASFASAQASSILVGAIVPVLAWRLAADVALERDLPPDRARAVALGAGLTSALYLPLLLHSALPDSTIPFAALAVGACLLMARLARDPRSARLLDPRLIVLGVLLGLAALTRNEAAWLAITWAVIAWGARGTTVQERLRMIVGAGIIAFGIFLPWAVRDWQVFGSPLPGQAVTNAFSVTGFDIFAWNDPPTLTRYLAVGPARLLEMRVEGLGHNLGSVLLLPGFPIAFVGLLALPWQGRARALRPVVIVSVLTFLVTSLLFPVATTWGTFLHAAGPVHVLLVISALLGLDTGIATLGARLGWTRPVAWLAAVLGMFWAILFSAALLPSFGAGSRTTVRLYQELGERMATAGHPLDTAAGPVISNFPIWLAETRRIPTLALPDEPPTDVLDLAAAFPGTRLLVLVQPESTHWPADLDHAVPGSECFRRIDLGPPMTGDGPDPLADVTAYEIACP